MEEPAAGASGKLRNIGTDLCLDGKHGGSGAPVYLSDCNAGSELVSSLSYIYWFNQCYFKTMFSPGYCQEICDFVVLIVL